MQTRLTAYCERLSLFFFFFSPLCFSSLVLLLVASIGLPIEISLEVEKRSSGNTKKSTKRQQKKVTMSIIWESICDRNEMFEKQDLFITIKHISQMAASRLNLGNAVDLSQLREKKHY